MLSAINEAHADVEEEAGRKGLRHGHGDVGPKAEKEDGLAAKHVCQSTEEQIAKDGAHVIDKHGQFHQRFTSTNKVKLHASKYCYYSY